MGRAAGAVRELPLSRYDVITIGGGLGGAALAKAMAERGARVLVVETERRFRDRVRGEILLPWGVGEARALGLDGALRAGGAHEVPWFDMYLAQARISRRDFRDTTPQQTGALAFFHPAMQEAVAAAAARAGAELRRGSRVRALAPGPTVTVESEGRTEELRARLVVGADGRGSAVRRWAGFETRRDPDRLLFCGVLLDGMSVCDDASHMVVNPMLGRIAYLFPQGGGRVRAYVGWHTDAGVPRLSGGTDLPRFVDECVAAGALPEWYAAARASGPLATFDGADTWVDHPHRDGIALIGDAASSTDPTWGQGMSHALRDVRLLRDALLATDDWSAAGDAYAEAHDRTCAVTRAAERWIADLLMEGGPEADARRARALPLLAADMSRFPDFGFSGPDGPLDDTVRQRFFGEDLQ